MSRGNVEIVRQLYDADARGDVATVYSILDEEIEWDVARSPSKPQGCGSRLITAECFISTSAPSVADPGE